MVFRNGVFSCPYFSSQNCKPQTLNPATSSSFRPPLARAAGGARSADGAGDLCSALSFKVEGLGFREFWGVQEGARV